jgi:hypothetical protein
VSPKLPAARLLCLCLAGLLPTAATANAGWKVQRAQAIAAAVWHHPCADHVTIEWGDLPATGIAVSAAEAFDDECRIVFAREPTTWVEFCTTMIHEYGHLAGYRDWANTADPLHSSNPHSVMAQNTITVDEAILETVHGHKQWIHRYVGLDRRCADHGRIYLGMRPDGLAKREQFSGV